MTLTTPVLNVVGAGRVGGALARLWREAGVFSIGAVCNRSTESAARAVEFIGAGRAVRSLEELGDADAWMLSVSDEALPDVARGLLETGRFRDGAVVFHTSGALSSRVFAGRDPGVAGGSVHPVKSFAERVAAVASFQGTPCGIEGDDRATSLLERAVLAVGGVPFPIATSRKLLYHAGAVLASNGLVALAEAALRTYVAAGVPAGTATELLGSLMAGTLQNGETLGTTRALTGPVQRGDVTVVAEELGALGAWSHEVDAVYRALGRVTVELASVRGEAPAAALARLAELFDERGEIASGAREGARISRDCSRSREPVAWSAMSDFSAAQQAFQKAFDEAFALAAGEAKQEGEIEQTAIRSPYPIEVSLEDLRAGRWREHVATFGLAGRNVALAEGRIGPATLRLVHGPESEEARSEGSALWHAEWK